MVGDRRRLRDRLASRQDLLGTWAVIPSASTAEILGLAGFDFVIVDMEHGTAGFETAEHVARAAASTGCDALVRVPGVEESSILRALDLGATGVIVPQVESGEAVAEVIRFSKYPPSGDRGHSPFTRAGGYTHVGAADRMRLANEQTVVAVIVEGNAGLEALPEILDAGSGQLDMVYIGVYDLAKSLGRPGEADHPEVVERMGECAAMAKERSVSVGSLANAPEGIASLRRAGVNVVAYQNDTGILMEAAKAIAEASRVAGSADS